MAYGSLLQERRRVLHARIVETVERLAPDRLSEQVERLAHHALRGEVWRRQTNTPASPVSRRPHAAYREAVAYFEQALEALVRLPECRDTLEQAIDLRLDLRNALFFLGDFGVSSTSYARPKALLRRWVIRGGWGGFPHL